MATVVQPPAEAAVRIPEWVRDLPSFRRWAKSDDYPERGWYAHLNGDLWLDPTMERVTHNQVKTKVAAGLTALVDADGSGMFFGDRMLLTNEAADLSTEPDGMFASFAAIDEGRVRLEPADDPVEVVGSPDMVLEVVSPTSVEKDTVILRDLYWRAGVREYWIVDVRRSEVVFDVLRFGPKGYVVTRKQGGWVKSGLFGRSFRLSRQENPVGQPAFTFQFR